MILKAAKLAQFRSLSEFGRETLLQTARDVLDAFDEKIES